MDYFLTALLIDCDPTMNAFFTENLTNLPFKYSKVTSVKQAYQLIFINRAPIWRDLKIALISLDDKESLGCSLAQHFRQSPQYADLPLFVYYRPGNRQLDALCHDFDLIKITPPITVAGISKAVIDLQASIKTKTEDALLREQITKLIQQKDYKLAVSECEKLIIKSPHLDHAFKVLGDVYFDSEQLTKRALQAYKQGLEVNGNNVQILSGLGQCHYRLGELIPALSYFSQAVSLSPFNHQVIKMLIRINHQSNNEAKAQEYFTQLSDLHPFAPEDYATIVKSTIKPTG